MHNFVLEIKSFFLTYINKLFIFYKNPKFVFFVILSYGYLFLSYRISENAAFFSTKIAGPPLNDLMFSLFPYIDTGIHNLALVFIEKLKYLILFFPAEVLFAVFSLASLVLVRSLFINLTHLGIPENSNPVISSGTFGGDLFFSGHVAFPFLMALVFWNNLVLRYFFLVISMVLGIDAVVGRYHYSIDVFAAPFVAYGVYKACKLVFIFFGLDSLFFIDENKYK